MYELITLITGIVSLVVLIVFFVIASNIASIAKHSRNIDMRLMGIQSTLDRIVKDIESNKPAS